MDIKDIKDSVDLLQKTVGEKVDAATKAIGDNVDAKIKESTETSEASIKAVKEELTASVNEIKAKAGTSFGGGGQPLNFANELGQKLSEKASELKAFKDNKFKGFGHIEMESKVVGNFASATSLTGSYFVEPTLVAGVTAKLFETVHMRNLLPVGSTNSNTIRYVVDNGGEGAPTMVAEGAAKPQMDRDLEIKDSPVRKIATHMRLPEEMVDDIPYLQSFLVQIGIEEVMIVEDNQILYGDGTGQNLTGFNTTGTPFAAGTSIVAAANEFDVIGAAKKQIRNNKIGGNLVALINPTSYYNMRYGRKDTTNNYLFMGGGNGINLGLQVDGVQIYEHTAVTEGGFFVFSPQAASIYDRAGTTVRFYDQDQDNAIKNLITIVIEKRLALATYRPLAIVKGTFATAITDLGA